MQRFERRQISADITQGVRPYVQAFEARYGALPNGYWEDEYVLGFVPTLAGLFARGVTRGKISKADQRAVVQECLDAVSGGFGAGIMGYVDRLTLTAPPDFVAGTEAANKVMAFSTGKFPADDPDIMQAQATGRADPNVRTDQQQFTATATALVNLVFYDVVNQRLMGTTDIPETDSSTEITPIVIPRF